MNVFPHQTPHTFPALHAAGLVPYPQDAGKPLFVDPSVVAERMGEINNGAIVLDQQIKKSASTTTQNDWNLWFAQWSKYYQNANDGSIGAWWIRGDANTVDQVERYEAELLDWRKRVASELGQPAAGAPLPQDPQDPASSKLGPVLNTIALIAGIGATAYLAHKFF